MYAIENPPQVTDEDQTCMHIAAVPVFANRPQVVQVVQLCQSCMVLKHQPNVPSAPSSDSLTV